MERAWCKVDPWILNAAMPVGATRSIGHFLPRSAAISVRAFVSASMRYDFPVPAVPSILMEPPALESRISLMHLQKLSRRWLRSAAKSVQYFVLHPLALQHSIFMEPPFIKLFPFPFVVIRH